MAQKGREDQASAVVVAVGDYDNYEPLPAAAEAARGLAVALAQGGYHHEHHEMLEGGESSTIGRVLDAWFRDSGDDDTLVPGPATASATPTITWWPETRQDEA